ncbi:MAG: SDR family oxidoreductase [Undibacterium sp.]|nr:SDR family oxidoreductase [Opitutaceae bacterium]
MNPSACVKPTILITGATGFLGGALAAEMLPTAEWANVLLIVRAEDAGHAFQRAARSLARFTSDLSLLSRLKPEQVMTGDFTQPATFIEDPRLAGIKRVVHCAALTSFGANTRVFSTNIDGTLRFVHNLRQVASIERFLHVSTAMICGDQPAHLVREDEYPRARVKHLVNYTESKAEAERLLRLTLPGFPLVVVRPTIIAGHTRLGCSPSGSIYWTFRMADALGMITCSSDARIDVVPVDYAAEALRFLLLKPKLLNTTYHISGGEDSSCTWREIAAAFAATRVHVPQLAVAGGETEATHDTDSTDYQTVAFEDIAARRREFDTLFGACNKKFMLGAAHLYAGFAELDTVFDSSRLRMEGMPAAPRFSDYLHVCERTSAAYTIAEQGTIDFA